MADSRSFLRFELAAEGTGVAQTIREDGSPHVIRTDAVTAFGGQDTAPAPLTYALAALTSCNQVTAQVVARGLGITVGRFEATLKAELDTAVLATGAQGRGNFDHVHLDVSVETDASDEQFARLQSEVERRCPVTRLFVDSGVPLTAHWTHRNLTRQAA